MIFNLYDSDTGAIDTVSYDSIISAVQAASTNMVAKIYNGIDYIKMILDKNPAVTMNGLCKMIKNIPAFYSQLSISEVNIIVISITENGSTHNVQFVYDDSDFDSINLINLINKKHLATFHKMITISDNDKQRLIKKTLQNNMKELSDVCSKLDKENKYKAWQLRTKEIDGMAKDEEYSDSDAYIQINGDIVSSKSQFAVYNEYMNNIDGIIRLIMDNRNMFSLMNIGTDKNKQLVLKDLYPYM
jgi:hypothetical protein